MQLITIYLEPPFPDATYAKFSKTKNADLYIQGSTDIGPVQDYKHLDHYSHFCSSCRLLPAKGTVNWERMKLFENNEVIMLIFKDSSLEMAKAKGLIANRYLIKAEYKQMVCIHRILSCKQLTEKLLLEGVKKIISYDLGYFHRLGNRITTR